MKGVTAQPGVAHPLLLLVDAAPLYTRQTEGVLVNLAAVAPALACRVLLDHQGAVFLRHVGERDTHFKEVVVRVWIERPILMPLHSGTVTGILHVQFVVVEPQIRPQQRFDNIQDSIMTGV